MRLTWQRGFVLLTALVFTLLASVLITFGSHDLSRSYLNHQLQQYQSCQLLMQQLEISNTQACPPCPIPESCTNNE